MNNQPFSGSEARCPASCGELLQGLLLGSEKLVSCPINWFSTVRISEAPPDVRERPFMRQALLALLAYAQQPASYSHHLCIQYESTIPVGKGMASSTADIAATLLAASEFLHIPLTLDELAKLCVSIEPTDSTIFPQLTLFDHNNGSTHGNFAWTPPLDLLILEPDRQLMTQDYHRRNHQQQLKANQPLLTQAWQHFQHAMHQQDIRAFGLATTLSAQASQHILPKPAFSQLLALIERFDLPGLTVAHSGTVVGLWLDPRIQDPDRIRHSILHHSTLHHEYPQIHHTQLIAGGVMTGEIG
jgi:L-threonine kinase